MIVFGMDVMNDSASLGFLLTHSERLFLEERFMSKLITLWQVMTFMCLKTVSSRGKKRRTLCDLNTMQPENDVAILKI